MTTKDPGRDPKEPGYRGALSPREDNLAVPWIAIVVGIFVLIIVLSVLGIPSRFAPTESPPPSTAASASAAASAGESASAEASAEASTSESAEASGSAAPSPSAEPSASVEPSGSAAP